MLRTIAVQVQLYNKARRAMDVVRQARSIGKIVHGWHCARPDPDLSLWTALLAQDFVGMRRALALGANPDAPHPRGDAHKTPLIHIAQTGSAWLSQPLFEFNVDINRRDESGATALMHAGLYGHLEVVRTFLSRRADCGLFDNTGAHVMHLSARHPEISTILVEHGEPVDVLDSSSRTPMHRALLMYELPRVLSCVSNFIRLGADLYARDERDRSALDMVMERFGPEKGEDIHNFFRFWRSAFGSSPRQFVLKTN